MNNDLRYPPRFPVPIGWFLACFSDEVGPGEARPLSAVGRELVVWRTEDGVARVHDAFCPHLGAHLGHGGWAEGDQLVCPFHGWQFAGDGTCAAIPYSDRVNRRAQLRTYEVDERCGLIMFWWHPAGVGPLWDLGEVPEWGDAGYTDWQRRQWDIPAPWQETGENGLVLAHFPYLHRTGRLPILDSYETDGPIARVRTTQQYDERAGGAMGRIDTDTYGPGFNVVRFSGIVDTTLIGALAPIDEQSVRLSFSFTVKRADAAAHGSEDAAAEFTKKVGDAFVAEVSRQLEQDLVIWKHKAHIPVPALADGDGPIMQFRRWAQQFYVEEPAAADA